MPKPARNQPTSPNGTAHPLGKTSLRPVAPPQQLRSVRPDAEVRLLVADDDGMVRQTLRAILEEEGYTVDTAATGPQAMEQASEHRPALVLLDMVLPHLDGTGVAMALQTAYGRSVPVIVVTADGHAREKAERIGACGYLVKPFDVDELLGAVRHGLSAA